MNLTISFHRIKLLAIRYLAEHGRRDLVTICAYFIAFAFIPRLGNNPDDPTSPILFGLILFIGGMRFTARIFHEIHSSASGMHYLHIPASRWEKFLLNGAFSLLFFPILCLILYYGGTIFGNLIAPVMPSVLNYRTIEISSLIPFGYIPKMIPQYLICHSVFFLGSLVFKKHPTTKTFIANILFSIAVGIIQMVLMTLLWENVHVAEELIVKKSLDLSQLLEIMPSLVYLKYLCYASLILFFWMVSYYKFKEKQV